MKLKTDKKKVGQRIFSIRNTRNETLEEFGKHFSASKGIVLRWENGTSLPNKGRLEEIARIGNIDINHLLYGDALEFIYINSREVFEKIGFQNLHNTQTAYHLGKQMQLLEHQRKISIKNIDGILQALTTEINQTVKPMFKENCLKFIHAFETDPKRLTAEVDFFYQTTPPILELENAEKISTYLRDHCEEVNHIILFQPLFKATIFKNSIGSPRPFNAIQGVAFDLNQFQFYIKNQFPIETYTPVQTSIRFNKYQITDYSKIVLVNDDTTNTGYQLAHYNDQSSVPRIANCTYFIFKDGDFNIRELLTEELEKSSIIDYLAPVLARFE